jgi:Zn-dependent M16 (insulinase) family peptidase
MNCALQKGEVTGSGFEILEVKELPELDAIGIWARHQKSGAEVFHVLNDDSENLFSFVFATPPKDSTGVAHILEHMVFCGSASYPLKDAFLVLAQGSLQTYLNALTYPDKTIYPASSMNEHDYFNLMSVYGDAVFRPLLSEWTFMQEGHHLFYDPDGKLNVSGVVYNEMKGAYSSLDAYAGSWSVKAVLPGTPYEFDSGGDPECILDLDWEGLKEFHRVWYSPANCRIFLAGNIPTEKQLAFLDEKFFSSLPAGSRNDPIKFTERWESPRSFRIPCPAVVGQKPTVLLSWLLGDAADLDETVALMALSEILIGHVGSPLTRALIDSGLGEGISRVSGLDGQPRETSFCVGLRGLSQEVRGLRGLNQEVRGLRGLREIPLEEAARKVEALIFEVLERLERDGIAKEEIEAVLSGTEFSHSEIRRSGGPFALVWMNRSFVSWLYGGTPLDSLLFVPLFAGLKRRINEDGRFFEKMIRRYLLDNPHRAFIIIEPREGFLEEKEAALTRRLEEIEASLSGDEKADIRNRAEELVRVQEKEDSPKALATIPHLSRNDLSPEIEIIKREYADASGVPMLIHPIFTNGITYIDLAFPLDVFSPEDYFWFPFFSKVTRSMGLPGMDYGQVSNLIARTTGGIHITPEICPLAPGSARTEALPTGTLDIAGRDWIIFCLSTLDEKVVPSLDLLLRLITETDFSDLKRLRDLVLASKNALDSALATSGHLYASSISNCFFSRRQGITMLCAGLDQIVFLHKLAELDVSEISAKLKAFQTKLAGAGVLANITGNAAVEKEVGKRFGSFGVPRPRNPASEDAENFFALSEFKPLSDRADVFTSSSLMVGSAAMSLRTVPYGSPLHAAELVLSHQLSTGALWEEIRMKGGAYGASAVPDHMEGIFSFYTYRDPNPLRSLEAFSSIISEAPRRNDNCYHKDSLEKAVIGTYSTETGPFSPADKGSVDFIRFLYGVDDWRRSRKLKGIIAVTEEQIEEARERLADQIGHTNPVIIAGKTEAEKAAARLGVEVRTLPV